MFLVMGASMKEKQLDFVQTSICKTCGAYGRLEAFMTYSYFSIFFIPIFKWNKKYYLKASCCETIFEINKELGRSIEMGENIKIDESKLRKIDTGYTKKESCPNCFNIINDNYKYCPKCGQKLL